MYFNRCDEFLISSGTRIPYGSLQYDDEKNIPEPFKQKYINNRYIHILLYKLMLYLYMYVRSYQGARVLVGRCAAQDVSLPAFRRHVCDGRGQKNEQRAGIPFRTTGICATWLLTVCIRIHTQIQTFCSNLLCIFAYIHAFLYAVYNTPIQLNTYILHYEY